MYDVIYINIGKSRADWVCVYISTYVSYKTKVKTLNFNRK